MTPDEAQAKLGTALRTLVHREGLLLRAFSAELGFGPDYLGRAFRGRYSLRVELVFRILQRLTVLPFDFFDSLFPFGGPATLALAKTRGVTDLAGEAPWVEYYREQMLDARPRTLAEYPRRFGNWLRTEIAERGLTQRAISEALEMGPRALGQAMRGNTELTFFHVFGVLGELGVSPARFFLEIFTRDSLGAAERLQRRRTLDYYERIFEHTARLFLERREAKAKEMAKKAPEAPASEAEPGEAGEPE